MALAQLQHYSDEPSRCRATIGAHAGQQRQGEQQTHACFVPRWTSSIAECVGREARGEQRRIADLLQSNGIKTESSAARQNIG